VAPPLSRRLPDLLSSNNARLASARRLTSRKERRETGRFLAEGTQAVREALAADAVVELFATAEAIHRHPELVDGASEISAKDAAALSETVTPQGLVAVCRAVDVPLERALERRPRLLAMLVEANDPGNAGTILRTADAAGADAVLFAGDSVDVYNGKLVRASAGSLFHLDLVTGLEPAAAIAACRAAGLRTLATSGAGTCQLDELIDAGELAEPTAWIFGNEARGLSNSVLEAADHTVRVPIYGAAESLNLAAAAAICLYGSARAQRASR
jgi:TrmH family RNA methyltransferase